MKIRILPHLQSFKTVFPVVALLALILLPYSSIILAGYLFDDPHDQVDPTVRTATEALTEAGNIVTDASALKNELDKLNSTKKANNDAIKSLRALNDYLSIKGNNLLTRIDTSLTKTLPANEKSLNDLLTKLQAVTPTTATNDADIKTVKDKIAAIGTAKSNITTAKTTFKASALAVFTTLGNIFDDANANLASLKGLKVSDGPDDLLKNLLKQLPTLESNVRWHTDFDEIWATLEKNLKDAAEITAVPAATQTSIDNSKQATTNVLGNLDNLLGVLTADVINSTTSAAGGGPDNLFQMRQNLDADLPKYSVAGSQLLEASETKENNLETVFSKAETIASLAKTNSTFNTTYQPIADAIKAMDPAMAQFKSRIELVKDGLAGDFANFKTDFVPLYYFTDVPALMQVLNPLSHEIKDVSALKEEAESARNKLNKADLDVADANATVNGLQTVLRDLQNDLQQAKDKAESSNLLATQATNLFNKLSDRPDTDPKKAAAKQRKDTLDAQKDSDQKEYDELKDKATGLPKQIADARVELNAAQRHSREARSEMLLLAQTESEAFANARANEPIYLAENIVTNKDPLKQVIIYGFASRKLIYIRGTRDNVDKAKNIIAFFDRPAPQARLGLLTLELNSIGTPKGAERLNRSLQIIEQQLSNSRAEIATVLSYLRECITHEVEVAAVAKEAEVSGIGYNSLDRLEDKRWERLFFYDDEVLRQLGFDPDKFIPGTYLISDVQTRAGSVARATLPDPTGTMTLGESLIVLALAKPAHRNHILTQFNANIEAELDKVRSCPPNQQCDQCERAVLSPSVPAANNRIFFRTSEMLGFNSNQEYTAVQREIVDAITLASVPRLLQRMEAYTTLDFAPPPAVASPAKHLAYQKLKNEIKSVLQFLQNSYAITPTDLFGEAMDIDTAVQAVILKPEWIKVIRFKLIEASRDRNIMRLANAQIAKTDGAVKLMIDAMDEDINRIIIEPMLCTLRRRLAREGDVGVGVINRTSVLATNRVVARVDPRSSAQLAVGEEQDALAEAQQLANIVLSVKTAGLLGGLSGIGSTRQEREVSETYGLNSGSVFKVTPIFDPTGQTLRFQFDYVMSNLVTNPDGSVTPQLPRIERHTVNTEVQLNNLELREISRFEANSRVGIATSYKGGLPVIKDIPYVNKTPLLGWFTRRAGKAAETQQSLILGQTTMYPTIADIFDLLSGDDYNFINYKNTCQDIATCH